jgi:4-hydroxy-4-methyl-2-oxoglutarate aldolase
MTLPYPPTCALADVLAVLGRPGLLDRRALEPVHAPVQAIAGLARTVRIEPGAGTFDPLYDLLSMPLNGAVIVISAHDVQGAVWGEILSTAAVQCGALAAVIDGPVRDHGAICASGLWLWGGLAQTVGPAGNAHIAAIDETVEVAGRQVHRGDLVILDDEGVIVLRPDDAVLDEGRGYADAEAAIMADLLAGEPLTSAYAHKADFLLGMRTRAGASSLSSDPRPPSESAG